MELGLNGRKAVISGANRGIGRTIAQAFAAEGIAVAALGREVTQTHQSNTDLADEVTRLRDDLDAARRARCAG